MNNRKHILKFWCTFGIILLAALGTITVAQRWHRLFPSDEVSEIYQKYAHTPGIDAAFVKDYRINDTVTIDATQLEATTDSAWAMLQTDFNVPAIPEEYKELFSDCHIIDYWFAPKNNLAARADSNTLDRVFIVSSRETQTISIFHITSATEADLIICKKSNEISQQK